ncbi:periodic tryptophan protein 1 [Nematocida sp. AWRm80]|nr:periodic tryptophan protein 1 [Nematocida sp. AWRm80]
MIIKASILSRGKACEVPLKYSPNKEVFSKYAHLYHKTEDDLYNDIYNTVNDTDIDINDMSSEERDDINIKPADRLVPTLIQGDDEYRMDVYLYDEENDALYVHHDIFLHGTPTSMCVLDRENDPMVFVSNEDGSIVGYNLFVANHFLPDVAIEAHSDSILDISCSGSILVSLSKSMVKVWDASTLKVIKEYKKDELVSSDTDDITAIYLHNDTLFYCTQKDIFSMEATEKNSITKIFSYTLGTGAFTCVNFSGEILCAGLSDGSIIYIKGTSKEEVFSIHSDGIVSIGSINDRYIYSSSLDETVLLYDTVNRESIYKKDIEVEQPFISISPDDSTLFVCSGKDDEIENGSFKEVILRSE